MVPVLNGHEYHVPFKTPLAYWQEALQLDPKNIDLFPKIQENSPEWAEYDHDLHVYPYVSAVPAILSMGCKNRCFFCPTAEEFKGRVYFGNPENILPQYAGKTVHFMDENFFQNDMEKILPLLKFYHIEWLAMGTAKDFDVVLDKFGEAYLWECGLRVVEAGLENIVLMDKVSGTRIDRCKQIAIYYLNMTFLPGETKETIKENAKFMQPRSLQHPIHFNNGVWYAPGQYFFPYSEVRSDGIMLPTPLARTQPTFVPFSFLDEEYEIKDLERTNWFSQIVYGLKLYPEQDKGIIKEFIIDDFRRVMWMVVGIRIGGIV